MIGGWHLDVKELKNYIYENRYVEQILESIGCHHIKYHASNSYWTCWHIHGAVNEDKVFTRNELADMFPKLLGHIGED